MRILYLVKTSDESEHTQRRQPLPVRLVIEPESRNFFKSLGLYLNLTFQPLSENWRINFLPPKTLNLYKFSIKMRTSASPGCCTICMVWSAWACHRRGNRPCGVNGCTPVWEIMARLETLALALVIWTSLDDSYRMWQFWLLCGDVVFDDVRLLYAVKIVARFYTVQYEHEARCGCLCIWVCSKFRGARFCQELVNWITTNTKGWHFFQRHGVNPLPTLIPGPAPALSSFNCTSINRELTTAK